MWPLNGYKERLYRKVKKGYAKLSRKRYKIKFTL